MPEYVRQMQQEMFEVLTKTRSLDELPTEEPKAQEIRARYVRELENADIMELAIHRRASRMNYSRRAQRLRQCRHIRNQNL